MGMAVVGSPDYQDQDAAIDGFGLACVPEDMVQADIANGKLQRLLAD
jgi:DNA-binding transcriptional LysR family regulator